jgi:septal ring factor EnvC (AmiA/AmiB activator)
VSIDELKRDRDERITVLRSDLESKGKEYDSLKKANAALVVQYDCNKSELDQIKAEHGKLVDSLNKSNKLRHDLEEAFELKKR